jgi:NTE family protein
MPRVQATRRPDVLVLGSGGVLGEAWLRACLAGLEAESSWDLRACDAFVGTSAGSIVAAALAAGHRPRTADEVARTWEREASGADAATPGGGLRDGLGALARRAGGTAFGLAAPVAPAIAAGLEPGGAAVRAALLRRGGRPTREIPRLRAALEEMGGVFDGRLRVATVDRATGRRVIFGAPGAPAAGVTEAVLASCAVPWVFRPVAIDGREYVDGGFWSAANVDAAPAARGAEVLCLVPTASARLAVDRLGALRAFASAGAAAESLVLRRRGARVRIVAPDPAAVRAIGPNLFDGGRRREVEAAGYAQGRALAGTWVFA